jgi:hypothetical protein
MLSAEARSQEMLAEAMDMLSDESVLFDAYELHLEAIETPRPPTCADPRVQQSAAMGIQAVQEQDNGAAVRHFSAAIDAAFAHGAASDGVTIGTLHTNRAIARFNDGEISHALKDAGTALQLVAGSPDGSSSAEAPLAEAASYWVVVSLMSLGRTEEACAFVRGATARLPDSDVLCGLGDQVSGHSIPRSPPPPSPPARAPPSATAPPRPTPSTTLAPRLVHWV